MKSKFIIFGSFLSIFSMMAQEELPYIHCATQHAIQYQESLTPNYKTTVDKAFETAKNWTAVNGRQKSDYTIPVVVHIVYNTPEQNLHDSIILNQIDILNKDFNRLSDNANTLRSVFEPVVGPAGIYFELATVDPNGNTTTGIIRTQTENPTFGSFNAFFGDMSDLEKVKSTPDGGSSPWNQGEYLNIWVCNMSVDFMGEEITALLGYATPPDGMDNWPEGSVDGLNDGVVIQYQCFGSNNPNELPNPDGEGGTIEVLGRTVTHEVGHYLGLRHIWGDGDCNEEDGVDDTPNATSQSDFDCDISKNTCVDNIAALGGDAPDMIENFMDYSAESCMSAFTLGQIEVMVGVLEVFRPSLGDGNPLSTQEHKLISSVYPNPFSDKLTLKIESVEVDEIRIIGLDGKEVLHTSINQTNSIIETTIFQNGMYILQLYGNNKIVGTQKIVKVNE
jgi:hypothetical protein